MNRSLNAYRAGHGPDDPDLSEDDEEFGVEISPTCVCGHELIMHDHYAVNRPCQTLTCRCLRFQEEEVKNGA